MTHFETGDNNGADDPHRSAADGGAYAPPPDGPHFLPPDDRDRPAQPVSPPFEVTLRAPDSELGTPLPVRVRQLQYIDGQLIDAPHPSQEVQDFIGEAVEDQQERMERNAAIFERLGLGEHSADYGEIISIKRRLLRDYGTDTADVPMIVVPDELIGPVLHMTGYSPDPGEEFGMRVDGHILIFAGRDNMNAYGTRYIEQVGLHEGSHASRPEQLLIVTTDRQAPEGLPADMHVIRTGGLIEYAPTPEDPERVLGELLEEMAAEHYRVQANDIAGTPTRLEGTVMHMPIAGGGSLAFVPETHTNRQVVVPVDDGFHINVPAKYLMAAEVREGSRESNASILFGPGSLMAYMTDIVMRNTGGRDRDVAEAALRLNDTMPGLFEEIRQAPFTIPAAHNLVARVARSLGIGTLRDLT